VPKVSVEYVPLAKLLRWPRNPKEHALADLNRSISRFGFIQPMLIDERTGKLVAGHGRLDTLEQMRAAGDAPPQYVIGRKDDWMVPVIRGISFNSDGEAEAYLIADNQLTISGGWNETELTALLEGLAAQGAQMLEGTGFDQAAVDAMVRRYAAPEGDFKEFTEDVANDVELITCPNCGTSFPK
jgi:hypothetical protein